MSRLRLAFIVAVAMVASGLAARAQVTTDQLNKLSLEALTAPPPPVHHVAVPRRSYAGGHPAISRRAAASGHAAHVRAQPAAYRGGSSGRHGSRTTHASNTNHEPNTPRRASR